MAYFEKEKARKSFEKRKFWRMNSRPGKITYLKRIKK